MSNAENNRVQRHDGRRPRNKIAALPHEVRSDIAARLLDGETYSDIRAALAGTVAADAMPGNSAFGAYQRGAEFADYRASRSKLDARFARRRSLMTAIRSADGTSQAMEVATFSAIDQLLESLESGTLEPAELPKVANSIATLRRTLTADAEAKARRQLQQILDEQSVREAAAESAPARQQVSQQTLATIRRMYGIPDPTVKGAA